MPSTFPPLPDRPDNGNKGTFGRVLVVGGHGEMIGAPVLAGTAALRGGAGLVQLAVDRTILPACLSITPELIGLALPARGLCDELLAAAEKADVIALGPGLGQSAAAKRIVAALIRLAKPMVIDADALNILAAGEAWPRSFKAHAVLTPHPGEMKRLSRLFGAAEIPTDDAGRSTLARRAAEAFGQVVVLKGQRTVIADGRAVHVNPTGDSSLAKAGTGDVLTGLLASLIAQGMKPIYAARAACWLHGKAGELAGAELGQRGVLARDVIGHLSGAFKAYASPV